MKTKKEIMAYFEDKISHITYDIEYHSYKNDEIIKFNLVYKRKLIIDIAKSIGINNNFISEWIKKGKLIFDKEKKS